MRWLQTLPILLLGTCLLCFHLAFKRLPDQKMVGRYATTYRQQGAWNGKVAPDIDLETLGGDRFRLHEHVGREVVILNFFATWSGPCKIEMPELDRFVRVNKGNRVVLVGIDAEERKEQVSAFVHELGVGFPVGLDESGEIGKRYGVDSLPTTVAIGADGRVWIYQVGGIYNTDVAFTEFLKAQIRTLDSSTGISEDEYLQAIASSGSAGPAIPLARSKRIAAAMRCPCGCSDKVATCQCATAQLIRKRLQSDELEGREDADIIRALDREFCVKGG